MNSVARPLAATLATLLVLTGPASGKDEARDSSSRSADRSDRQDERNRSEATASDSKARDAAKDARDARDKADQQAADRDKDAADKSRDADKAAADRARDADKQAADQSKDAQKDAQKDGADQKKDAARGDGDGHGGDRRDDEDERRRSESGGASRSDRVLHGERGIDGRERVRGELLLLGSREAVAAARNAGYALREERPLPGLGESLARFAARPGESVEDSVAALRALRPEAGVAPNHLFRPSQAVPAVGAGAAPAGGPPSIALPASPTSPASPSSRGALIGVIDTGADTTAPKLAARIVATQGFAGTPYTPRGHGTLVAELAASGGARLAVADVFGTDDSQRLVAPVDALSSAVAWLVAQHAAVINISIEGPDNAVLARLVERARAGGSLIIAAAGNGGPAAPPAFPAAYPGVVAVTAIDGRDQVYRRANRGDYLSFAAPGVNLVSGAGAYGGEPVSGTSFAAPLVAARIASGLAGGGSEESVIAALKREARDLGAPGRDPVYGWGALAAPLAAP